MKKSFSIILALVITLITAFAFGISVSAAGVDDGVMLVTDKNSTTYLGVEKSAYCVEFNSANGKDGSFLRYENFDINGDGKSDICDLGSLDNKLMQSDGTDLDLNSTVDSKDLAIMRKTLIGITDILN